MRNATLALGLIVAGLLAMAPSASASTAIVTTGGGGGGPTCLVGAILCFCVSVAGACPDDFTGYSCVATVGVTANSQTGVVCTPPPLP